VDAESLFAQSSIEIVILNDKEALEGPRKGMEKQQCVCFRMGNVY
jgi:hypothetical protein